MLLFLLACQHAEEDSILHWKDDDPPVDTADTDTAGGTGEPADPPETSPCIDLGFTCIDPYEAIVSGDLGHPDQGTSWPDGSTTAVAVSRPGVEPAEHLTWYQAFAACENAGAHLCTWEEWRDACDGWAGVGGTTFPWGEKPHSVERCVVAEADGSTRWTSAQPTGSMPDCAGPTGVYDQMGNVWEWVDIGEVDDDGRPVPGKVGGAWYAGYGSAICGGEPNTQHDPDFEGAIGFRCCR